MIIGCIADDFTGAGDAASFLVKGGMRTILLSDNPKSWDSIDLTGIDAVVIALKTRTIPSEDAVRESLRAIRWLESKGTRQYYFKYCSTFDSTPKGNIGPVADAVMEELQADHATLCPALPANGRVVKDGDLYVKGVLLDESPMKNHPLTPMWDHRLKVLMEAQSRYRAYPLSLQGDYKESYAKLQQNQEKCYYIPDYADDSDAAKIIELFGKDLFLTGGSGILEHLAANWCGGGEKKVKAAKTDGTVLLLAGSCSVATRSQIDIYNTRGFSSYKIDPMELLCGENYPAILDKIGSNQNGPVLIYSSDTPENVRKVQEMGTEKAAKAIETFLSGCAKKAAEEGIHKIIVAGGETSGAVTKALEYQNFEIGESIAPGVPVLTPLDAPQMRLVLKSGNFGQEDFFIRTIEMLED